MMFKSSILRDIIKVSIGSLIQCGFLISSDYENVFKIYFVMAKVSYLAKVTASVLWSLNIGKGRRFCLFCHFMKSFKINPIAVRLRNRVTFLKFHYISDNFDTNLVSAFERYCCYNDTDCLFLNWNTRKGLCSCFRVWTICITIHQLDFTGVWTHKLVWSTVGGKLSSVNLEYEE